MIKDYKDYKKKKEILINYNKIYYDQDSSKVDDATYDALKKELLIFEKKTKLPLNDKKYQKS